MAGHDVVREAAAVRRNIGVTGQDATLDEALTGRQNLVMVGELCRLGRAAAKRRASELLETFELADAADRVVKGYSGGMRRRLDLAASLVMRPPVLFLDEPTTGLDPTGRQKMWGLIRRLVADGATLWLTTQYLDEADALADRIAVVDHGHVIAEGTPAELKAATGSQLLEVTLTVPDPKAVAIVDDFGVGQVLVTDAGRRLRAAVPSAAGLATAVLRAFDAAGVGVDDIAIHKPSLDEVFATLTGTEPNRSPPRKGLRHERERRTSHRRRPAWLGRLGAWLSDVWVMTRRNLIHVRREPMQLSDVTIQPVLFTLMFVYVFGSAMVLPGGGGYKDFVIAGLLVLNLIMSAPGTAVGLATDVSTGVIDRLHTLPMSPTSILVGRSLSDLLAAVICSAIVALTGLAIGWRTSTSLVEVLAGFGVVLLFSYAFHWMASCLGLAVADPSRPRASPSSR